MVTITELPASCNLFCSSNFTDFYNNYNNNNSYPVRYFYCWCFMELVPFEPHKGPARRMSSVPFSPAGH